jgi:hypothetical protein
MSTIFLRLPANISTTTALVNDIKAAACPAIYYCTPPPPPQEILTFSETVFLTSPTNILYAQPLTERRQTSAEITSHVSGRLSAAADSLSRAPKRRPQSRILNHSHLTKYLIFLKNVIMKILIIRFGYLRNKAHYQFLLLLKKLFETFSSVATIVSALLQQSSIARNEAIRPPLLRRASLQ